MIIIRIAAATRKPCATSCTQRNVAALELPYECVRVVWFRAHVNLLNTCEGTSSTHIKFANGDSSRVLWCAPLQFNVNVFAFHATTRLLNPGNAAAGDWRWNLELIHLACAIRMRTTQTQTFNKFFRSVFAQSLASLHACIYSAEQRVIRFFSRAFFFFIPACVRPSCTRSLCSCDSLRCSLGMRRLIHLLCGEQK